MHLVPKNEIRKAFLRSSFYTALPYFSMVLDQSGKVPVSNNIETFVRDGNDDNGVP